MISTGQVRHRSKILVLAARIYSVALLFICLWPEPVEERLDGARLLADAVMFIPLGVIAMTYVRSMRWRWTVLLGLVISVAVEGVQLAVLSQRTASLLDVAGSTLGVVIGAGLVVLWRRTHPRKTAIPLRVLTDVPKGSWGGNPYIQILHEHLEPGVTVKGYSRREALHGDYDIVQLHWPEHRLRGATRHERMVKRTWFALWMLRVRITRIPVVRTRHNLEPHDGTTGVEGLLLRSLTSLSRGDVWLSDSSRAQAGVDPGPRNVVIPHGDYAPWIARIRPGVNLSRTPGPTVRLVGLGAIKRYKNFEEAIVGVSGCEDFTLTIAGNDSDHAYLASLQSLAAETNNVVVQPGRLEDGPLIDLALASDATLLTYESLYNSGVVFLALSLGRPVIARDGPMTRELRDEYGPEWIGLYEGRLTPAGLRAAWKSVAPSHAVPIGSPQRAWPQIAREHERLYRWALTSAG